MNETEQDVNAHCLGCPGTGWLWGGSKCFDQCHRVRACPVPDEAARLRNGVPLRAPLCACMPAAPKPAPIASEPEPVPVTSFDISDEVAVARHARVGFRSGREMRSLASELAMLGVPAPNGKEWQPWHVKRLLLRYPPERRPPVRRAKMAA